MKQAAKPELLSVPAEIDAVIEKEWAVYISTQAIERVRRVSSTQAVQVLEMILDGHQASDIAKTTGLSHPSVYSFKKRLKKQLCIEVLSLTADLEP